MHTHWGPMMVGRDDDGSIHPKPHPKDLEPSALGLSLRQSRRSRVANPSIRRSWLESGPGASPELRGQEPFVEVSWDRAIELVSAELARVQDNYGHDAIFGGSYGWGSAGRMHMPNAQIARFMRLFGGCTDVWGTYSSTAAEGILPYIFGMPYFVAQSQLTSWSSIAKYTELFVSFGGLRLSNAAVTFIGQGPHRTGHWMQTARENGMTFVNVSPLRDDIAPQFSPEWIAPRPGTDVALMAALIQTLVEFNLEDQAFLKHYCHGWQTLKAYLGGNHDGIVKNADWASRITGLDASDIQALAKRMASSRTLINVTYAMQRQDHGEQPYWMAVALAAALGQIGLPGGGFAFHFGSAGNPGSGRKPPRIPGLPVPPRPEGLPVISVSRIVELLEATPGDMFDAKGQQGAFPDTKLVYWCGGNIYHHHQDLNRLNRAWSRPETIIVHEPFWTPMAKRADIVLPATTPLERRDLGNADDLLLAVQPVHEPYENARDDYAIFSGLAQALGFGEQFTEGRSADEWVEHLYELFRAQHNDAPTFEEFLERGTLELDEAPMGETEQDFLAQFRADPKANPLSTPSGLIELYSETINSYEYDDCPPHPVWLEPYEWLGQAGVAADALHLISNQPATRLHSQYDHGEVSTNSKVQGREPCRLNPVDAKARGIQAGDIIKLFNDRGACMAAAVLSEDVAPGVVQLSTGAWYDPDTDGVCKAGNPNVLTRDKGTSTLSQGPSAHTCLVWVEAVQGPLDPVTAHNPPQLVGLDD